ncbi:MAG: hypothetical protein AAFY20_07425 [Cyanobacteria bacterium J06639_14]
MDSIDRYGLTAQYAFEVKGSPFTSANAVVKSLRSIETQVQSTQKAVGRSGLGKAIDGIIQTPRADTGRRSTASQVSAIADAAKLTRQKLSPLKQEFRALKAEARNIDFGDLTDQRQFREAQRAVKDYTRSLRQLGKQVAEDNALEREFSATIKRQEAIALRKAEMANEQRLAGMYARRKDAAGAVTAAGTAGVIPLVQFGREAISILETFDARMSQVQAISGATDDQLGQLRDTAKGLPDSLHLKRLKAWCFCRRLAIRPSSR